MPPNALNTMTYLGQEQVHHIKACHIKFVDGKYFFVCDRPPTSAKLAENKGKTRPVNTFTAGSLSGCVNVCNSQQRLAKIYSHPGSDNAQKKEHFLLSAVSLGPLKPEHKSPPDPPHVCCCQISCLDNASRRHCLDRNMICETVMSHHLT